MPEDDQTPTEPVTPDVAAETPAAEMDPPETGEAEIDWKTKARDWEKRAKDNLAKLKSEQSKPRTADSSIKQAAAEEARTEMAQSIGKALGLIKEDEQLDPTKLTEQLTASQAQVKQTQIELAVYQAASAAGANGNALLDSRAFLNKIASLEPSDSAGITAAIAEAVAANSTFVVAIADPPPASNVPKPNPAQGSSGGGAPTIDDQIAIATKDKNWKLAMHLQNQKLLSPGR